MSGYNVAQNDTSVEQGSPSTSTPRGSAAVCTEGTQLLHLPLSNLQGIRFTHATHKGIHTTLRANEFDLRE